MAVITGISRGIGFALTKLLLVKGYTIVGGSRTVDLQAINHDNFIPLKLDLTNEEHILQFTSEIKKRNINIDLLINNAGIGPDLGTVLPKASSFRTTFRVNVEGTVFLTEQLIDSILNGGRILNVSSKMGSIDHCQSFDSVAYRMSKSALNMYTKVLSRRLEGNIDVASIHPGWVRTSISKNSVNGRLSSDESASRIIDYIENRFKNGDFWDAETGLSLKW